MITQLHIILGDQLYADHPCLQDPQGSVIMVESLAQAQHRPYHVFKLAYLYTIMREYADSHDATWHSSAADWTAATGLHYWTLSAQTDFTQVLTTAAVHGVTGISLVRPTDTSFCNYIESVCKQLQLTVQYLPFSPFLTQASDQHQYMRNRGQSGLKMQHFYQWQRRRCAILLTQDDTPLGGQWSYDEYNRKKLPKKHPLPTSRPDYTSAHWQAVCQDIHTYFSHNPGTLPQTSWLPLTRVDAVNAVTFFAKNILATFGDFEDALTSRSPFVFHSLLSAPLNYGLITPAEVLRIMDSALQEQYNFSVFDRHDSIPDGFPLHSVEGFIRQIIGWREWIHMLYAHVYSQDIGQYNFFQHTKKLEDWWWTLDSQAAYQSGGIPLQHAFDTLHAHGYNHHIQRLMVLANWMTLQEYDPMDCFEWFRSMYVDALDWVMVPNVLGMGLFADGGIFATKPYVAGGNYIKKMSDYPDAKQWESIWTDAFWKFLLKHEDFFVTNHRMAMLISARKKRMAAKSG